MEETTFGTSQAEENKETWRKGAAPIQITQKNWVRVENEKGKKG
ncbi:hypothetical protein V6Z12_A13G148000 [Gossypium hirsutum]